MEPSFSHVVALRIESRHRMSAMRARRNRRVTRPASARAAAGAITAGGVPSRSTWDMLIWNHTKLWIATAVGIVLGFALPSGWALISRVLTGWNAAMLVVVGMTYLKMRRLDSSQLRARYQEEDPTAPVIVVVVIASAMLSLLAIVGLLSTAKHVAPNVSVGHLALATATVVSSWCIVHTMYMIHYADIYYSTAEGEVPPLNFPDTREPLFWDFVYFAFTIGVACQTADVATTRTSIRRTVIVHSIIAFVFNLFILGFAINVSAGLLGGN